VRIEFTYARGPDHFEHPSLPRPAQSVVPSYVIAALLAAAGGAFAIAALVYHAPQAAGCGVCGALLGVLIGVAARQRGRRQFVMPAAGMEPRQWVINDQGFEINGDQSSAGAAWEAFRHVWVLPRTYMFVMKDGQDKRTFDIPRQPLSEADDESVREVLTRHGIMLLPRHPKMA
jgi:hypothetical protein